MKKVAVITGGGSGMGLATARLLAPQGYYIILVGRTASKLESAVKELKALGGEAEAFSCDVANRESCFALAKRAAELGEVKAVLHLAGLSPHMGDAEKIMRGNALGTVNINDAFFEVLASGGCIIDTSSMSAYLTPKFVMPKRAYPLARKDPELFIKKMMRWLKIFPKDSRAGAAYAISKDFVIWYARTDAARFGQKGCRVLSVTPGNFETPMGELEKDGASVFTQYNAIKRFGKPEEIAALYAMLIDERLGYLTGTDILCDGGCIAGGGSALKQMLRKQK